MVTQLLEFTLRHIVENPDKVKVVVRDVDDKIGVTMYVDQTDVARVIGRDGSVLRALRSIVRAASGKELADFFVDSAA